MDGLPLDALIRDLRWNAQDEVIRGIEHLEHSGDHPPLVTRRIETAYHVHGLFMD